ncbi:hypothetical protein [Rhizohabitans arisaemae]|nr:hypothetical protein [Rhizohabitans arisaemae]
MATDRIPPIVDVTVVRNPHAGSPGWRVAAPGSAVRTGRLRPADI